MVYELITEIEWTNQNARKATFHVENLIIRDTPLLSPVLCLRHIEIKNVLFHFSFYWPCWLNCECLKLSSSLMTQINNRDTSKNWDTVLCLKWFSNSGANSKLIKRWGSISFLKSQIFVKSRARERASVFFCIILTCISYSEVFVVHTILHT